MLEIFTSQFPNLPVYSYPNDLVVTQESTYRLITVNWSPEINSCIYYSIIVNKDAKTIHCVRGCEEGIIFSTIDAGPTSYKHANNEVGLLEHHIKINPKWIIDINGKG